MGMKGSFPEPEQTSDHLCGGSKPLGYGQNLRITVPDAAARPHHGSNPVRFRCSAWNGFSGRDIIRRQDLFAMTNRKNGNLFLFYPVNDSMMCERAKVRGVPISALSRPIDGTLKVCRLRKKGMTGVDNS
jgi:hypothetical protein